MDKKIGKFGEGSGGLGPVRNSLVRMRGKGAVHGSDACSQTDTNNDPRVRGHESVAPSAAVESLCGDANHADAEAGVEEGFVEI